MLKPTLLATAFALALLVPTAAAGCDTVTVGPYVLVPLETPSGTYYAYYDPGCDPGCHGPDWWVFEETNGVPGLQFNEFFGHDDDRCPGSAPYDTIVL